MQPPTYISCREKYTLNLPHVLFLNGMEIPFVLEVKGNLKVLKMMLYKFIVCPLIQTLFGFSNVQLAVIYMQHTPNLSKQTPKGFVNIWNSTVLLTLQSLPMRSVYQFISNSFLFFIFFYFLCKSGWQMDYKVDSIRDSLALWVSVLHIIL